MCILVPLCLLHVGTWRVLSEQMMFWTTFMILRCEHAAVLSHVPLQRAVFEVCEDACYLHLSDSHLDAFMQAYDKVAPVVQDAATTASPYVKSALTTAQGVAAPALRAVEPSVKVHPPIHLVFSSWMAHVQHSPHIGIYLWCMNYHGRLGASPAICIMAHLCFVLMAHFWAFWLQQTWWLSCLLVCCDQCISHVLRICRLALGRLRGS